MNRVCTKCKKELDIKFFYKKSDNELRYFSVCKLCYCDQSKERYSKNINHIKIIHDAYYDKNKDKINNKNSLRRKNDP